MLDGFGGPWWVAGGWALDLFLGRQTRPHGDLDLAILRRDQPLLQGHLVSWDVQVAHEGELMPWAPGDWLAAPRHQFWVRRATNAAWAFEILLEDDEDGDWVFRREPSVRMPLPALGRVTADGIPYVAPEVALLYKANHLEIDRNAADFDAGAAALDAAARGWLHDAISAVYAGHPWLERLT